MELLQSQKNALFDLIVEAGLSPLQFEIILGLLETKIAYKGSGYYYSFCYEYEEEEGVRLSRQARLNCVKFSPSIDTIESKLLPYNNWDSQIHIFQNWLSFLKREVSQPDKWVELLKSSKGIKWDSQGGEKQPIFLSRS